MLINRNHTVKIIALCTILFLTTHLPISMAGESESPQPPLHYDMQGTPLSAEEAARLQQGLLPVYFHNFFARNVRMLPKSGGKEASQYSSSIPGTRWCRSWMGKPMKTASVS